MIKKFLFSTLILMSTFASSQIHEAGIQFGGSNYIGDIGPTNYIWPNSLAVGVIYKYNLNPRVALRGTFTYFDIKSDDANSKNAGRKSRNLHFSNKLKEFAVGVEYSWFNYNVSSQDHTNTPYILLEFALINYTVVDEEIAPNEYSYKPFNTFSIPFGLGYKTKLVGQFALAFELGMRYTFQDNLDYNHHSIPELQFGNPNNNDWYMFTGINLVYTFGRPPCYATRTF
jgi:hypothetical protein